MKKIISMFGLLLSLQSIAQPVVGSMPAQDCEGNSGTVSYSISGLYNPGNVFTLELSDASGSFSAPTALGAISSVTAGSIAYTLPTSIPIGTGYRVRITSSTPSTIGPDNGIDFAINDVPTTPTAIIGNSPVCPTSSQTYGVVPIQGVSSYSWTLPSGWVGSSSANTITTFTSTTGGNVIVVANNLCGSSASVSFAVAVPTVDDGNACTADFCSNGIVNHAIEVANVVCRASAGVCDAPERCDGVSSTCPTDQFLCATRVCRASAGACDIAEECTGTSAHCPIDLVAPSNTVCRAAEGACDVAESCDGAAVSCPVNTFQTAAVVCRVSAGICDVAEKCKGTDAHCPVDVLTASGTLCRSTTGVCDVAELCDGNTTVCPVDAFIAVGSVCRVASGVCDLSETCTGISATCPTDVFISASTICRVAAGVCDVAENCSGVSVACPSDALLNSSQICRSSNGLCDFAELCTGVSSACPIDKFIDGSSICRASTGTCDPAEKCTGLGINCPVDVSQFLASAISSSSTTVCAGNTIDISFTINMATATTYEVELSDAAGSFSAPTNIGTYTPGAIGLVTLTVTIPITTIPDPNYQIRVLGNGCISNSVTVSVTSCGSAVWIGNTTDWNTPGNWSTGVVPNSCFQDVTIPSGTPFMPTVSGADYQVGDISVGAGVTITLQGQNINVCGDWTGGTGTNAATVGSGRVRMVGSAQQQIIGSTNFDRLLINNSAGVTNTGDVAILNLLALETGVVTNNGTITFLSTSDSHSATLDHFSPGYTGALSGTVIAQRFIPVTGSNQHYMSTPLQTTSLAQFGASGTSGFVIPTSNCDETQLQSGSPYGSVFQYHEDQGAGCSLGGWEVKTSGAADNGRGYSMYQNGGTFSLTGQAQLANSITVPSLTNSGWASHTTLQGRPQSSGWNLVGNPFLAYLDLSTHAGFDNQVQVWMTNGPYTGTYQPLLMGSGTANIAPFQAFMIHRTNGSGNFVFNETECTNTPSSTNFYKANDNELKVNVSGNGFSDKTLIAFNADASNGFDPVFDANKFHSKLGQPTLYTLAGTEHLAIDVLPSLTTTAAVPLSFEPGTNGAFTFTFDNVSAFDPTSFIYLEDKKVGGNWLDIRANNNYNFNALKNDNWDRFMLHFTPAMELKTVDQTCAAKGTIHVQQEGPVNWNYLLKDNTNAIVAQGVLNQQNPQAIAVNAGAYQLELNNGQGYTTSKSVQVNFSGAVVSAAFNSSTNTPSVNQLVTFSNNSTNATTYEWSFGDGSPISTVYSPTHIYTAEGEYTATLKAFNADGCDSSTAVKIVVSDYSTTGIQLPKAGIASIDIYASEDKITVDFSKYGAVDASIQIFNVIGQSITNEKYNGKGKYERQLEQQLEAAYFVVTVHLSNGELITRKVMVRQ
jgi:PKD repeat protein